MDILSWSFPRCMQISSWYSAFHTEPDDLPTPMQILCNMCVLFGNYLNPFLLCITEIVQGFLILFFLSEKVHVVSDTPKSHSDATVYGFRAKTPLVPLLDITWFSLPRVVEWPLLSCCQAWVGEGSRERTNAKQLKPGRWTSRLPNGRDVPCNNSSTCYMLCLQLTWWVLCLFTLAG